MPGQTLLDAFIIAAPGIEKITAAEMEALGLPHDQIERGGIAGALSHEQVYTANLQLRTATRVIVRLASFHASSFAELERRAKKIEWARWIPAGGDVRFRVTCRKSRLYHSDAVAERLMTAAAIQCESANFGVASADEGDIDPGEASQLFVVRLSHDEVTVSVDSSGELLHRRGYRPESTRASLRETLAAAMLLASDWEIGMPLLDPLCGSGTIPIEAAMIARRIAPGSGRAFAFERWPSFDAKLWRELTARAEEMKSPEAAAPIFGGDRDAGAIEIAKRNAERAGVAGDIQLERSSLSESLDALAAAHPGNAAIVTNPPYGMRVSGGADLRNLYGMLGARSKNNRWSLGVLTADAKLARQSASLRPAFTTQNGGIPVTFFSGGETESE